MKVNRKIIEIDEERCDGCGMCVPSCAEGALEIIDGKARVIDDKFCDGLGACLGECPNDALHIIEREAEDFDEEAVEEHLKDTQHQESVEKPGPLAQAGGCPGSRIQSFTAQGPDQFKTGAAAQPDTPSALTHWPVQIRLVPPTAPFLKGADLLVVSDCAPVAFPSLHRDFLPGKVVLMGCPKFDDIKEYREKFTAIFKSADIRSITVLDMEVPCCSALPMIVKQAIADAAKEIPLERVTIGVRGNIINREKVAA